MSVRDRIAVSTWSLHRYLGVSYPHDLTTTAIGEGQPTWGEGEESLLGVPSALRRHGISRLDLCAFHLRSVDPTYLGELKDALATSKVELQMLQIDAGDITDPVHGERDMNWTAHWLGIAEQLGAKYARVIAGRQPPSKATLDLSAQRLLTLADRNAGSSVRILVENWFELLDRPEDVHYLFAQLGDRIGLNVDTGNWRGERKYADLASIFGPAELCYLNPVFVDGELDTEDLEKVLDIADAAGYSGNFTLIYDADEPSSEWTGLGVEIAALERHYQS
jgi:sugar phosphate isomerase/epimerase